MAKQQAKQGALYHRSIQAIISFLTSLLLAVALIGSGLFICCAPVTTETLSKLFSRWEGSAFTHEQLTQAALATRDYTVGSHDRDAVLSTLYHMNLEAAEAGSATLGEAPELSGLPADPSADEIAAQFQYADESYVLTDDALSHLDDVFIVVETARVVLIWIALFAVLGCVILGLTAGRRRTGKTIASAAVGVVALFAALALWVVVDFNGFFAFFHSLFFVEGTWTFGIDSLLIRMYPTEFWTGMGAVWLATTVLASLICFILGLLIKGKKKV